MTDQERTFAPIPAVILAGGKAKPDLQAITGQTNRALICVRGKTLLAHAVDAIHSSGVCTDLTVVGNVPESDSYTRVSDTDDFVENLFAGIAAYRDAPYVVVSTSDLPFVTGENVAGFVRGAVGKAIASRADVIYPIVPVELCYARFPGVRRTSLKLREGRFTGGNMMLLSPAFLHRQRTVIASAYMARKSPLQLASMLGWGTVLQVILAQKVSAQLLSVSRLEASASRLTQGTVHTLICDYPEIATDLDRASDFTAVGLEPGVSV